MKTTILTLLTLVILILPTKTGRSSEDFYKKVLSYAPFLHYAGDGMYENKVEGKTYDVDQVLDQLNNTFTRNYLRDPSKMQLRNVLIFFGDFGGDTEMFLGNLKKVYLKNPEAIPPLLQELPKDIQANVKLQLESIRDTNGTVILQELLPN